MTKTEGRKGWGSSDSVMKQWIFLETTELGGWILIRKREGEKQAGDRTMQSNVNGFR